MNEAQEGLGRLDARQRKQLKVGGKERQTAGKKTKQNNKLRSKRDSYIEKRELKTELQYKKNSINNRTE